MIVDPTNVTKYGLYLALNHYYNKVISIHKLEWLIKWWTEVVLHLKGVDFIPVATYQSLNLLNKIEILPIVSMDAFYLLQPYPGEESRLDITVKPFQLTVWIINVYTVCTCITSIAQYYYIKYERFGSVIWLRLQFLYSFRQWLLKIDWILLIPTRNLNHLVKLYTTN